MMFTPCSCHVLCSRRVHSIPSRLSSSALADLDAVQDFKRQLQSLKASQARWLSSNGLATGLGALLHYFAGVFAFTASSNFLMNLAVSDLNSFSHDLQQSRICRPS